MPPKKEKSPKSAKKQQLDSKGWEVGLLAAQIEEDQWKPTIYFAVGEKLENEVFLDALSAAINVPLRKLFSVISWKGTMKQISELGDPKKQKANDLPMFYEITEAAWALLDKGEEIPLPLICKLIKFQILCIKQKDLQKRRFENKPTGEAEATVLPSAGKKKTDKKSAGKAKGKVEKKSPEPPVAKKTTKLLKRGEVEVIDRCINDEPDDGPQHYIIIQGFQNLQFLLMLGELGINISAVIRISYEMNKNIVQLDIDESEMQPPHSPEATEAEKQQKEAAIKSLELFWKYLDPVLNSGKPGSKLFDIAKLQYTVRESMLPEEWNDDAKLELGTAIFEDIASMIYDCEDWKRQYQNYLHNVKLITVPGALKNEEILALHSSVSRKKLSSANLASYLEQDSSTSRVDMRYYNDLMSLVPLESLSVPLILHCMLEQVVATEESLTPPSELAPKPRKDGLDQSLADHLLSSVVSLCMSEDEKQKIIRELKNPQRMPMNEHSAHLTFYNVEGKQNDIIKGDEPLPNEEGAKPKQDIQLPVFEEENQKVIEMGKYEQKRPYGKQPLLLNLHDTMTQRTHHLQVIHGFDPAKVEQEMMKKLPITKLLNFTPPLPEIDDKRLASIQDLMYYCTSEKITSSEVERAFKQFLFESLKLTKVDENGELEEKEDTFEENFKLTSIPWDDPVSFAKEMKEIANIKKIDAQNNNSGYILTNVSEESETCPLKFNRQNSRKCSMSCKEPLCSEEVVGASEMVEEQSRRESLTEKNKAETLKTDIKEIAKLQLRSLMEWCYAEQHDPIVLSQVLQEAVPFYRCVDTYYHRQDNSTLLVLHNPMNEQRQCKQSWKTALHSDVGFRYYLEYVASLISDWVEEEEVKYQEEMAAKELEAQKLQITPSEVPVEPVTISEKPKKGKTASGSKTQSTTPGPQSKPETIVEEEDKEKSNEPFMREGSLKAWKKEQEKLKEEDQKKDKKGKKERAESKKKEGKTPSVASKATKSAKKSAKQDTKSTKEQETTSVILPEVEQPNEPKEEFYKFTGYNFGNDLIQVSGEIKSLFPVDGGHIQVKIINFLHGSTIIQVCLMKDNHHFFTYITDPIKSLDENKVVPTERKQSETSKEEGERTKFSVSKFESFSAVLDDGIILTLSKDGPEKEQKKVEEDPILAEILNMPPVHAPTPAPVTTPPPTAKTDKSSKNKSAPSGKGKHKKEIISSAPVEEPHQPIEEPKVEIQQPELVPAPTPENVPEPPVFLRLNACSPDGLLTTFFTECSIGINNEDECEERILLRQSYPIKTKGSQPCEAARKWPAMQEASRVITLQGTVVKYMMDGSTEILFADGTVSRSPDSGPISIPQPSLVTREQPEMKDQEPKNGKELKRALSDEGNKRGKHGDVDQSAPKNDASSAVYPLPGTWITTTPIGLVIGTKGTEKLDTKPILVYKATDPGTGEIMITRQDKVVTVFGSDNTMVEHADGTRITTFFQDVSNPDDKMQDETEVIPEKVTRCVKCIKVECMGFATVLMNWDECTCSAVFGNGTTIIANLQGMYQVFPASIGSLLIDQDGCALYTSGTNNDIVKHPTIIPTELQPGAYFMKCNSPIICEVMDPEGNYFQVMLDGNIFAAIHSDKQKRKDDQRIKDEPITYTKHAPRLFILHADGSGTELLRSSVVEEYIYQASSNSTTAVLKEQLPEYPGVLGITFLKPSTRDVGARWLIKKDTADIIPPNLQSRKWNTFPQRECKVPGPPIGMQPCDQQVQQAESPSPAVLKCPAVLEVRQLFQHEPINTEMQLKIQTCLKEYIERVLQKEQVLNEMRLKEPRNEEEVAHAANLLKLVLSLPDDELCQMEEKEANKVDVASIYEEAISSTFQNVSEKYTCEWIEADSESNQKCISASRWPQIMEQYRQELEADKACRLALRNMIVPPYFLSELDQAFDTPQNYDMDYLQSQTMKIQGPSADSGMDVTYSPTPDPGMHSDTCPLKRRESSSQQAMSSQHQYSKPDVANSPTYTNPVDGMGSGACSHSPTQQIITSQYLYSKPEVNKKSTHSSSAQQAETDTCSIKRSGGPTQKEVFPQCQYSNPETILQRITEQDLTSQKPNNHCSLHKPLSIPVNELKDIGTINGMVEYKPEELPGNESNIIFHKSLVIDAASQPRKEKVKLPSAILSSKPFSQPNKKFAVLEEPVRRKVNTVSITGAVASGLLKEPVRGFELFPRKMNFGVLQEGFTYASTVSLRNVGIDSCRFRVKQPPPSTGLRVHFKPGPVAAGLKTDLEVELYAMAIGLEHPEGAGYLCHYLEIQTEADELFLPITATVLTENVYKERPEEFPKGGKAAGVRLICTEPTFRMDIMRPRRLLSTAIDPVDNCIPCET
ncbi:sperm-associated antigen 17 isoform X2 [Hypanus sabinus]|uniref:sperm-associated antigen 17 isoform X2 n=1 Tax=Hypanus sabinus TaxID=79690 RepID=UPI0028C4D8BA|nr:sperm-associated antigen 17 isoform X2 [Hypanus sabinus]